MTFFEWARRAEEVLRRVFPGWEVGVENDGSVSASMDLDDGDPSWTFEQLEAVSQGLGTKQIAFSIDPRGPVSALVVSFVIKVYREEVGYEWKPGRQSVRVPVAAAIEAGDAVTIDADGRARPVSGEGGRCDDDQ